MSSKHTVHEISYFFGENSMRQHANCVILSDMGINHHCPAHFSKKITNAHVDDHAL